MSDDAAILPIRLELAPVIMGAVASEDVSARERIETELSECLLDLDVRLAPAVEFVESDSLDAPGPVAVYVRGRQCGFPWTTLAAAVAYVDGTSRVPAYATAALARLSTYEGVTSGRRAAEVLAHVCRAALAAQPEILAIPDEDGHAQVAVGTVDLHIDLRYLRAVSAEQSSDDLFGYMRRSLIEEVGLSLPPFHIVPDASLRSAGFAFRVNGVRGLPRIGLSPGTILVNDIPERLALIDVEAAPTLNPATHQPGGLIAREHLEAVQSVGLTTWDSLEFLILCLATSVREHAGALMTRDVATSLLDQLSRTHPHLERVARTHVTPDRLADVLRELLADEVPIRNLRRIVELVLRYETSETRGDSVDLVAAVRNGLSDVIAHKLARGTKTVVTYLLDPQLETTIGERPLWPHERAHRGLLAGVRAEVATLPPTGQLPAILTRDECRRSVRALLRSEFPRLAVVGYGDIPPEYNVQPIARIAEP